MSLDRLINLAKKTGDRLIVHDPMNGRDIVILDLDSYEEMVLDRDRDFFSADHSSTDDSDECFPCNEEDDEDENSGLFFDEKAEWPRAGEVLREKYAAASPGAPQEAVGEAADEFFDGDERSQQRVSQPQAIPQSENVSNHDQVGEALSVEEMVFYEEPV